MAKRTTKSLSHRLISGPSDGDISNDYNSRLENARSLAEEVRFILRQSIGESGIKVHEIDARVKELPSAIKKIRERDYEGLSRVSDLIGGRVVCLFRSDLDILQEIVEKQFQVDEIDREDYDDPDAFGYMSIHFQCRLNQECSGPRYDAIKSITFEVQLRTIGMHAWAAVSHYLDYKGDWDVPQHLKKDLNALSALFYVADSQFEAFYTAKLESTREAVKSAVKNELNEELINFDTLKAYILKRFPNRPDIVPTSLSELVQELAASEYRTIGEVERDIDRAEGALAAYERDKSFTYAPTGATRISLGIASPSYRRNKYNDSRSDFRKYEKYLKP